MSTCRVADLLHIDRRVELLLLAFFTCTGAVLGVAVSYSLGPSFFLLMRRIASSHASIVGLMLSSFFPFLITVAALCLSKPCLFLPVSLFKAFSYTLVMCSVRIEFLQAGWLVSALLLFSDTASIVALYWFWTRNIHGFARSAVTDLICCSATIMFAAIIDYIWVSPFLVALMND